MYECMYYYILVIGKFVDELVRIYTLHPVVFLVLRHADVCIWALCISKARLLVNH